MGAAQTARARVPFIFTACKEKNGDAKTFTRREGTQCAAFLQVKLSTIFILNRCVADEGEAALRRGQEKRLADLDLDLDQDTSELEHVVKVHHDLALDRDRLQPVTTSVNSPATHTVSNTNACH
jgi:hypothetical protein